MFYTLDSKGDIEKIGLVILDNTQLFTRELLMKIGFDIGGVLSKYPDELGELIGCLLHSESSEFNGSCKIYFITDQHPKEKVVETLIKTVLMVGFWLIDI